MYGFLLALLVLDGVLLGVVILLQAGKGGGLAAMGGGAAATDVLGGRQATTLLTRATWILGSAFMVLSLVLAILSSRSQGPTTVLEGIRPEVAPQPLLTEGSPITDLLPGDGEQDPPGEDPPGEEDPPEDPPSEEDPPGEGNPPDGGTIRGKRACLRAPERTEAEFPCRIRPAMHGDASTLSREVVRDLLYQGFQARLLAGGAGIPGDTTVRVDIRTVVMTRAMRHSSDGKGDLCCPGHLSPGPMLAFGATPLEFLRQLGRKGTAPAAARSGGRSWTDQKRGLIGWDGPPGTMTQVLAGAALAFAQRGQDRAALVFEEFVATETGGWHEGMNFAAAQSAPLIVVLDMTQPADRAGTGAVDAIARGYGVSAAAVAGEPYPQLFRTLASARRRAVLGRGPTLIAMLPRGEGDPWALHDAFVAWALEEAGVSDVEVRAIERAASAGVDHALNRLTREPEAEPHDALVPVCAHEVPQPPWTRRVPPEPGWRATGEPREVHDGR